MAIFVLVFLVGLGSALLFLGQNELSMSRSTNNDKTAFHLAEAGVEAARMSLLDTNGEGSFNDELITAAGADLALSLNPDGLRPVFDGSGALTAFAGAGDDIPVQSVTALGNSQAAGGLYAAFLSNDPVEGIANQTDLNRRVMITAIGVGENRASEVVQAIIEPYLILPPIPPAAMTMIGPPPVYDNGSSNSQAHSGTDCPLGGGIPNLYVPIVGTTDAASSTQVENDMQRPDLFTSGALTGQATVADLNNTGDPAMAQSSLPPLDPAWLDCAQLAQMVQNLIADADYYCTTDGGSCTPPVGNAGDIIVIDGDADAGAFDAGILLVTGQLTYSGNESWNGLVLLIGEGRLHRNGGGNGHNTGAVVLANIDPSPLGLRADKSDWCATGLGPTSFTVNGAGDSTISFCSDEVKLNDPVKTYRVTEFLQH